MSAGMAYEAMNNAGALDARLIVILNDNDMSIAPPTGAMSAYLARLASGKTYPRPPRDRPRSSPAYLRQVLGRAAPSRARSSMRAAIVTGGTLFEELGFYHVGPIDGHNLEHLLPVLKNVRDNGRRAGADPCRDAEGQGLRARPRPRPTNITASTSSTSSPARRPRRRPTRRAYTSVFAESLVQEAAADDKIVGDHRGHAVRHRPRPVRRGVSRHAPSMSASPSSMR